jgi:hypothetical protein
MAFVQSQAGAGPATDPAAAAPQQQPAAADGPDEERPSIWTPGGEV